jgi:glycosyltransferase involved in cell wall biosynthesis
MKIGIFTNRFYPSVGGVQASSRLMAQELVGLGHEVTVITRSRLQGGGELEEGYAVLRTRLMPEVARLAARTDAMIIRGGISKFAALPAFIVGARVIQFHEMAWNPSHQKSWMRRALLRQATCHVGVSNAALTTVGLGAGSPTAVLYNPVATSLWGDEILPLDARDIDILFVGRIVDSKGIWLLADALERVARPIRLSIVGEGPQKGALESRLTGMANVEAKFHGLQSGEALRQFYARARLVVVPSQAIEGMGMVVAEAMANGTPVLVSDQAPLRETAGSGGIAFEIHSSSDLATKIKRLFSDSASWESLRLAALTERERFGMPIYRQALSVLLNKTIFYKID